MQDATEICHYPELFGEPLSLELSFTFPLEHVTEQKIQKKFSEKSQSFKNESLNPTLQLYTLRNPIFYTNELPNGTPFVTTL